MKFRLILDEANSLFQVMDFTQDVVVQQPDLINVDGPDDACLVMLQFMRDNNLGPDDIAVMHVDDIWTGDNYN